MDRNFMYRRYVIRLLQNSNNRLYDRHKRIFVDNNYLYRLFSGGMKNTYYVRGFYYKILQSNDKNVYSYKFLIGKEPNCLEATLDYDPKTKEYDESVHIQYIQSYIKCGTPDGNMDDVKHLYNSSSIVYSFIQFIKDKFPKVKYITLIDEANYICDEKYNQSSIPLSIYYFLKYMTFYYMRKYKFEIYDMNPDKMAKMKKKFRKMVKLYTEYKSVSNIQITKMISYLQNSIQSNNKVSNVEYYDYLTAEIEKIHTKLLKYREFDIFLQKYRFKNCFLFEKILSYFLKHMNRKIYYYLYEIDKINFRYTIKPNKAINKR